MQFRFKTTIAILALGASTALHQVAFAQKVAIHATQAEVQIWRTRAASGPYKEEWDIIKSRADAFLARPDARWAGNTTNGCYNADTMERPGRTLDRGLRDAAFVYLVTGNTSYRDAARNALIAQKNTAGTDWSNRTKWCAGATAGQFNSASGNGLHVGIWVRRLVYAYSYIRNALSSTDRAALDAWFLEAGRLFDSGVNHDVTSFFPNRYKDDYTCSGNGCPGSNRGVLYYGGPMAHTFNWGWDNRVAANAALVAATGAVLNDSTLQNHAKRFVQEWLRYNVWPSGAIFDMYRWQTGDVNPQRGYAYAATALGAVLTIADHLARAGDNSLFEYSTSGGMFGSEGGPKTLLKALQHFARMTTGAVVRYASNTATNDANLIIDSAGPSGNQIEFVYLANNLYYKDPDVKKAYTKALPSSWNSGGYDPRNGDWGSYPNIRFMFGQQEGVVWPYSGPTINIPSPPSGLTVTFSK